MRPMTWMGRAWLWLMVRLGWVEVMELGEVSEIRIVNGKVESTYDAEDATKACPFKKSFMTPCVQEDGEDARADDGRCVGCNNLRRDLASDATPTPLVRACPTCGGKGTVAKPLDGNCPAAWAHPYLRWLIGPARSTQNTAPGGVQGRTGGGE